MRKYIKRERKSVFRRNRNKTSRGKPSSQSASSLRYQDAGVSIEEGDRLVSLLQPIAKKTHRKEMLGGIGGFAALIHYPGAPDKLLAASTDGVGTKLLLALSCGRHRGVGQDLVAMCVNDLICVGARPLFFLDYYASAKLIPEVAIEVLEGIALACERSGCVLLGGETAELPGMYAKDIYDLAGFAVGTLSREEMFQSESIVSGDTILGLASNGVHSNGYSLVRKIFGQKLSPALQEELLRPTRLYVEAFLALRREKMAIKGLAHITGGGLAGNLSRILPENRRARLQKGSWDIPEIFQKISREGNVSEAEMLQTFNLGVGLCAIVSPEDTQRAQNILQSLKISAPSIGTIEEGSGPKVILEGPALLKP